MKDILTAPFMTEMVRTCTNMYAHTWDERNGGNISLLLDEADVSDYVNLNVVIRTIPTGFEAPALDGKYFLVTGTGKYFKNVQYAPDVNLGLVRLKDKGATAELLWGFTDGGKFTSEFPPHMMSHAARLAVDPENRVIMHCHPANLLAMTYVHDLDERAFTRTLWQMRSSRLVVWAQHGIYGAGKDLDETFGLIETAEKAAKIWMKIAHLPIKQTITDDDMRLLAEHFNVSPRAGYLA